MIGRLTEWERDCLHWRGEVLTGRRAHYCADYDGLPVDDTCCEALNCLCFQLDSPRSPEEVAAIEALHPWINEPAEAF